MGDIREFVSGPPIAVQKLNELVRIVNSLNKICGDNFIKINRTSSGLSIGLNWSEVIKRIPSSSGGGKDIRRAKVVEDAPAGNEIIANLYNSAGIEATDGDDFNVTVYCNISGGSDLNDAVRRLETGDEIQVGKLSYDNYDDELKTHTLEYRWYALEGFQGSADCICATE